MLQKAYILIYATLYHNVPKKSNEIGIFLKFSQKFQAKKQKTILFLKESSDRKEKYRIGNKIENEEIGLHYAVLIFHYGVRKDGYEKD